MGFSLSMAWQFSEPCLCFERPVVAAWRKEIKLLIKWMIRRVKNQLRMPPPTQPIEFFVCGHYPSPHLLHSLTDLPLSRRFMNLKSLIPPGKNMPFASQRNLPRKCVLAHNWLAKHNNVAVSCDTMLYCVAENFFAEWQMRFFAGTICVGTPTGPTKQSHSNGWGGCVSSTFVSLNTALLHLGNWRNKSDKIHPYTSFGMLVFLLIREQF